MTLRQALIRARRLIESHRAHCICWALIEAGDIGAARDEIERLIGHQAPLAAWLNEEAGIPWDLLTPYNLREYRLRWIDHLLATNPVFQE